MFSNIIFILAGIVFILGGHIYFIFLREKKRKTEVLLNDLGSSNHRMREEAVEELSKMGKGVTGILVGLLKNKYPNLRWNAAEVLGKIGDVRAIKPLIKTLNDIDSKVCEKSIQALVNMGPKAINPLIDVLEVDDLDLRRKVFDVFIGMKKFSTPHLIAQLKSFNSDIRCRATKALGQIKDESCIGALARILRGRSMDERWLAAEALGKIGTQKAKQALESALDDDDACVRECVKKALEQFTQSS